MPYVVLNNAASTLSGGVTAIATAIPVQVGHGAKFAVGANYSYLTLQDASSNIEIVKLTSVTGDVLNVVRAQDGTAARVWGIGDTIGCRPCAAGFNDFAVGPQITNSTSKATPVNADELGITDSAASFGLKKLTWANLKATLVTYFNTLFTKVDGSNATGTWSINTSGNAATATNATKVTTNANLTGHVTSVGNAAVLGSFTKAQLNTAVSDANLASSGANSDITSMTAVTSISATGGTAVKGTNTNDNAAAGYVGEYMTAQRLGASALALTTGTAATITTLSLTAGDWDVWGKVGFITATATTSVIRIIAETTTGAGLSGSDGDGVATLVYPGGAALNSGGNGSVVINTGVRRFILSATTTVNLLAYSDFSTAGLSAFGSIKARRVR